MKVLDQLKLVLLFSGIGKEDAKKYIQAFESYESQFSVEPIKSLRFDNNLADFKTLQHGNAALLEGKTSLEDEVTDLTAGINTNSAEADDAEAGADNSATIDGEVPGLGTITAIQYGVRDEEPERYAFYCSEFKEQLFIRLFSTARMFAAYQHNSKIQIVSKFEFKGVTLLKYHSSNSERDRFAIYCPEGVTFTDEDFNSFETEYTNFLKGKSTAVFG